MIFETFCTANEGVMENLGTTVCDIRIGGLGLGAKLNVVSGLTNPLILGIDFLRDNGGHVNIPEGIVEFYDYTVQVSMIQGKVKRSFEAKTVCAMHRESNYPTKNRTDCLDKGRK